MIKNKGKILIMSTIFMASLYVNSNAQDIGLPKANNFYINKIKKDKEDFSSNKEDKKEKDNKKDNKKETLETDYDMEKDDIMFKEHFFNKNYKYENPFSQNIRERNIDKMFEHRNYTQPIKNVKYENIKQTFKKEKPYIILDMKDNTSFKSVTYNGEVISKDSNSIEIKYPKDLTISITNIDSNLKLKDKINIDDEIGKIGENCIIELKKGDTRISPLFLFVENLYPRGGMAIPLMTQTDDIWKNYRYGDSTNYIAGCGPTALSMVISYLEKELITPANMISRVGGEHSEYMISNQGSLWSMMEDVPKKYNLKSQRISTKEELEKALNNKEPVIALMKHGYFTNSGHYIVIRGIDSDGYLLVNDPAEMNNKNNYKKSFLADKIIREQKAMWKISK